VVRIRRVILDGLMSLTALTLLFGILLTINADLRHEVMRRLSSGRAVTSVTSPTRSAATGFVRAARSQTIGYASLVLFVGAALVLVIFMLRV
jgi:hypothetical protein